MPIRGDRISVKAMSESVPAILVSEHIVGLCGDRLRF
jgi:hypothetical protein